MHADFRGNLVGRVPLRGERDVFLRTARFESQPTQLALRRCSRLRLDLITQTVGGIVAANTILIGIHFQNILRPIRIVL